MVHGSRSEGGSALSYSKQNLPLTLAPFCLSQVHLLGTVVYAHCSIPSLLTNFSVLCTDFSAVK